jgi:hypothetical protein
MINKDNIPDMLYHYCSVETFMKIIENQTIRLSNIFKMNDYTEVIHILSYLSDDMLLEAYRKSPFNFTYNGKEDENAFPDIITDIKNNFEPSLTYISCYSESNDDLGQWRAYGDDGKGFAIGFDGRILSDIAQRCNLQITEVSYKDEDKSNFIKYNIVNNIIKSLRTANNDPNVNRSVVTYETMVMIIINSHMSAVFGSAVRFKNYAFVNEKEWRLFLNTSITSAYAELSPYIHKLNYGDYYIKRVDFINKNGAIVSFMDLGFESNKSVIKQIIIGPCSRINKKDIDLDLFLRFNGFSVSIDKSDIPYIGI